MSLDPVPWAVGGGAEHAPEVARLLGYVATGGHQGVIAPADFAVKALPAPGSAVRVGLGAASLLNRYGGGSQQAYLARASSTTDVPVVATGAASGRVDMVVLRIDDPQYGGSQPVNAKVGPYVRLAVIQGVAAGATKLPGSVTYPALPLARIDIPANTTAITQAMITDLRELARPRRQRDTVALQPYSGAATQDLTSGSFAAFPAPFSPSIQIPDWATRCKIIVHVGAISGLGGSAIGEARIRLGSTDYGSVSDYDTPAGTDHTLRLNVMLHSDRDCTHLAGTVQPLVVEMRRTAGPGYLHGKRGTTVIADIEFLERPI